MQHYWDFKDTQLWKNKCQIFFVLLLLSFANMWKLKLCFVSTEESEEHDNTRLFQLLSYLTVAFGGLKKWLVIFYVFLLSVNTNRPSIISRIVLQLSRWTGGNFGSCWSISKTSWALTDGCDWQLAAYRSCWLLDSHWVWHTGLLPLQFYCPTAN